MSFSQRFFKALLPSHWAEDMEAESRTWMVRCTCGFEMSVWDSGGIRWKAAGNPRRLVRCSQCGQVTKHTVYRKQPDNGALSLD